MKEYRTALACAVLGTAMTVGARVIENPDFKMAPSLTFSINRVELSDTATRVGADFYGLPGYWISAGEKFVLHGQATGNEYPLRRIEGIPVSQKVFLPDSAYVSATFVFPPLAPADTLVDFKELDVSEPWNVTGLNLGRQPDGKIHTNIVGSIEGQPNVSWLVLMPYGDDIRLNKFRIIPVRNGKFRYTLATDEPVLYNITKGADELRGSITMYSFFAEGGDVHIDFPADDDDGTDSSVKGGALTQRYSDFIESRQRLFAESKINARTDSLEAARAMYTPEAYAIKDILESGKHIPEQQMDSIYQELARLQENGRLFTPAGQEAKAERDKRTGEVVKEIESMERDFIRNDKSLVGLCLIYNKMKYDAPDFRELLPVFADVYRKRFPVHKYTKALARFLGEEAAEPGYKVPDFSAPDLDGNIHKLSELIKGKVAVVDLWASWCGPCREHSKALVPVYEKWKDRGFTVVGIARENGNTDAMKKAIKKDGYPWLNLVELNDAGHIWERYGAAMGGGKVVLVDRDGTVISIAPTAQEVEGFLEESCKE